MFLTLKLTRGPWVLPIVYFSQTLEHKVHWGQRNVLFYSLHFLLFSWSVMSNSLQLHELQHARLPYPSQCPKVCSNWCPLSQGHHPTISSSVTHFPSCLQSFPPSGSFPMRQLFASGGQSTGVSASASVLLMSIQGWFLLGLTGLISLLSKGLSEVFSSITVQRHQFLIVQLSYLYMTTGKIIGLIIWTSVHKAMSLFFNMLSTLVNVFLPRSKHLLISWL